MYTFFWATCMYLFWTCSRLPCSGIKIKAADSPKYPYISTRLHGVAFHNTIFFIVTDLCISNQTTQCVLTTTSERYSGQGWKRTRAFLQTGACKPSVAMEARTDSAIIYFTSTELNCSSELAPLLHPTGFQSS